MESRLGTINKRRLIMNMLLGRKIEPLAIKVYVYAINQQP